MSFFADPDKVAKAIKYFVAAAFPWIDFQLSFERHPFHIKLDFVENKKTIAGFQLIEQPNCCGVLISTKTYVEKDHQGKGIATEMMALKEKLAREFGYSCLSATVNVSGNPTEVHILESHGWQRGIEFVNQRTNNTVAFFHKNLNG